MHVEQAVTHLLRHLMALARRQLLVHDDVKVGVPEELPPSPPEVVA